MSHSVEKLRYVKKAYLTRMPGRIGRAMIIQKGKL